MRLSLWMLLALLLPQESAKMAVPADGPTYTAEGQMKFPEQYREWVFLTSGVDMSYNPKAQASGHTVFDNVFVNPSAYRAFLKTGIWPDKTVMVLETAAARLASRSTCAARRKHAK